jgi:hypothetical protein
MASVSRGFVTGARATAHASSGIHASSPPTGPRRDSELVVSGGDGRPVSLTVRQGQAVVVRSQRHAQEFEEGLKSFINESRTRAGGTLRTAAIGRMSPASARQSLGEVRERGLTLA